MTSHTNYAKGKYSQCAVSQVLCIVNLAVDCLVIFVLKKQHVNVPSNVFLAYCHQLIFQSPVLLLMFRVSFL